MLSKVRESPKWTDGQTDTIENISTPHSRDGNNRNVLNGNLKTVEFGIVTKYRTSCRRSTQRGAKHDIRSVSWQMNCATWSVTISYGWDVMSGNRSKSAFFERGRVTLSADFRGKGAFPINHCWCQSSRVIALSCGVKTSAVHHLVLSQSTRVTDGQRDRQTDGQNYDSQDRPRIWSRAKNH